ncbi:hypothetical protein CEXT_149521 [Caerostris extrusa]|uniref:Uncharacterized protein n=1 Tax=Caerostris extrusa TaxID=172846 RepID=A0AAV4XTN3_CAEEX|nr:hypothetical protein CEXT_149521 [Caerostris extrusa]
MWQAGIVLVMNENDFPKFDFSDEPFMQRMVVCPFRSKFVEVFDTTQEPHTFVRDSDIGKKFDNWRSSVLDLLWEYKHKDVTVPRQIHDVV